MRAAPVQQPTSESDDTAWRRRHAQRHKAQRARKAGWCLKRTKYFELAAGDAADAPFFVTAFALDGAILITGDGAGKLVEWDLAAAKLRARPVETLPGMVTSVELDNVTRLALESRSER